MMSNCLTWEPISDLEEPDLYHYLVYLQELIQLIQEAQFENSIFVYYKNVYFQTHFWTVFCKPNPFFTL